MFVSVRHDNGKSNPRKHIGGMKKFEYYALYLRPGEDAVQILDRYGDAGWEAFAIVPSKERGFSTTIYLKREKP